MEKLMPQGDARATQEATVGVLGKYGGEPLVFLQEMPSRAKEHLRMG